MQPPHEKSFTLLHANRPLQRLERDASSDGAQTVRLSTFPTTQALSEYLGYSLHNAMQGAAAAMQGATTRRRYYEEAAYSQIPITGPHALVPKEQTDSQQPPSPLDQISSPEIRQELSMGGAMQRLLRVSPTCSVDDSGECQLSTVRTNSGTTILYINMSSISMGRHRLINSTLQGGGNRSEASYGDA